jgi:hypothetical protein
MDQTVMSFAGTAARGSAIPTPVEGMYTHLEDTDRLQFWNGSAWVSPFGATLVAQNSFTAASSVEIDNVFTSAFDFYKINLSFVKTASSARILFQLRASGSNSTTNYRYQVIRATNASVDTFNQVVFGTDRVPTSDNSTEGGTGSWSWNVYNPALALNTTFDSMNYAFDGSFANTGVIIGEQNSAEVRDGFRFFTAGGTFTGKVKVYGMRNS